MPPVLHPAPMSRLQHLGLWLTALLIRLIVGSIGTTCRVEMVQGGERLEEIAAGRRPVIFALWHNRAFYFAHFFRRRLLSRGFPLAALSSRSRDGELGAKLGRMWGADVIRGSTSRGGTEGLRRLYRTVRRGESCALLPDGPRGPVYEVKSGAIVLAQMTGAPIIPMAWAADRCWRIRSWDRMIIPRPFARVAVAVGEPLAVPRELAGDTMDREAGRLKRALDELVTQVEERVGVGA